MVGFGTCVTFPSSPPPVFITTPVHRFPINMDVVALHNLTPEQVAN